MLSRLLTYGSFVRFSHSVFALPFALTGVLLAGRTHPITVRQVVWVVAAMVFGRSAALGFNTAGTFDYICGLHPNMKGSVEVK